MMKNFAVNGSRIRVLVAVLFAVFAVSAVAQADDHGLAGTWRVTVQIQNCATGANVGAPFQSLLSFERGGTMHGTTTNPVFPLGARTPDFGEWRKAGDHQYYAASEAFVLAQSGPFPVGTQRIVQTIQVNGDAFTSAAHVTFYDANRNVAIAACALATGQRFE